MSDESGDGDSRPAAPSAGRKAEAAVIRAGWLKKQGGTIKTWKRRWVELRDNFELAYYDSPEKTEAPKGVISLKDYNATKTVDDPKQARFCLYNTNNKSIRAFQFVAESNDDRTRWMEIFQDQMGGEGPSALLDDGSAGVTRYPDGRTGGWLLKMGGMVESWKKRWFVLSGKQLAYYKNTEDGDQAKNALGTLDTTAYNSVDTVPKSLHQHNYEFKLTGDGMRTYYLVASSEADRRDWANAMEEAGVKKSKAFVAMDLVAYRMEMNADGTSCNVNRDKVLSVIEVPEGTPMCYQAMTKVAGGDYKSIRLEVCRDGFKLLNAAKAVLYKFTGIVGYKFSIVNSAPLFQFFTRSEEAEKHKVATFVLANEAIMRHMEATVKSMIQLLLKSKGVFAHVLYAYDGQNDDELTLEAGMTLTVLKKFDDGWILGALPNGKTGMVPQTHVEFENAADMERAEAYARDESGDGDDDDSEEPGDEE